MDVINRLLTIATVIEDHSIAVVIESELLRDSCYRTDIIADLLGIRTAKISESHPLMLGYDQDMERGLGRDVMKGQDRFVFKDDIRRNLLVQDLVEESHTFYPVGEARFPIRESAAWLKPYTRCRTSRAR